MRKTNYFLNLFVVLFMGVGSINAQVANIPYTCDFEDATENAIWGTNSLTANQWVIGTATYSSATTSVYISNTGGTTANYTNAGTVAPLYREFYTTAGEQYQISFDWKANGFSSTSATSGADLRVYWVDDPNVDVATWIATNNTEPAAAVPFRKAILQGKTYWGKYTFVVTGNGSNARLVFLWRNGTSATYSAAAYQPGGCIDDIDIILCPPATIPYSHTFEDIIENAKWVTNSSTVNKWVMDSAESKSPINSAYISNDG